MEKPFQFCEEAISVINHAFCVFSDLLSEMKLSNAEMEQSARQTDQDQVVVVQALE